MEARLLWEQEVAGSNPASPTMSKGLQRGTSSMHQHLTAVHDYHLTTYHPSIR